MIQQRRATRLLLYAIAIVTSAIMIVPLYWMLATSFKPPGDVFASPIKWIPDPWTLANYRDVFTLLPFGRFFINSVIVTLSIVAINILFDTAAAYGVAQLPVPVRDVLFFVLSNTLMVPFHVNLIPLFRIMVALHRISPYLGVNTYFGLIAPSAIQVFGIFLLRQYISSIPDDILDSARVDGASEFKILRSIVFPLAGPGI